MAKRPRDTQAERTEGVPAHRWSWALILLLIPFVALLYPPFYASLHPELGGIPFFIWYQFLWVLIGSAITAVVYGVRRRED